MLSVSNRLKEMRQKRRLTLQQLADASGTSKSQIDKLEKGERRLTVDWMVRLAKPLGCDPRALLPGVSSSFEAVSFGGEGGLALPVRALEAKEKSGDFFELGDEVDRVPCPPFLAHTKNAYGFYMVGMAMSPMFRPRQLLYVNPYRPPVEGGGAVVILKDKRVAVRAFGGQKETTLVLRSYYPKSHETRLALADIEAIHAVVGMMEPV